MVTMAISTAVMTRSVPAAVVIAIAAIKPWTAVVIARAVVVGIRRVAWVVVRRRVRIVVTGVVITTG